MSLRVITLVIVSRSKIHELDTIFMAKFPLGLVKITYNIKGRCKYHLNKCLRIFLFERPNHYFYFMKHYFIYILKCSDGTYYTGVTSNLEKRVLQHKIGHYKNSYTSNRQPVELVFHTSFFDINEAIRKEKQIKKWSKRKKEALIRGEYQLLPNLAKKKF